MKHNLSLEIVALALFTSALGVACGPAAEPDPSRIAPSVPTCARLVAGSYYDDHLGTACQFGNLDGLRVCLPVNMPRVISGVCNPNGPDRLWIDQNTGCGNGSSSYVLSSQPQNCGDLRSPIQIISSTPQPDQRVYLFDAQSKACTPSGLTANASSPIVDRAPPPAPVFLYAKDFPSQVCD